MWARRLAFVLCLAAMALWASALPWEAYLDRPQRFHGPFTLAPARGRARVSILHPPGIGP